MTDEGYNFDLMKFGFEGEQALTAELFAKYGMTCAPRKIIIREGDLGDEVYLIISGRVVVTERIRRGSYKVLSSLGPGEIFGEMAVLDSSRRSATLIAATTTKLLVLSKQDFGVILKSHPRWTFRLLGALAKRIHNGLDQIGELHAAR